MLFIEVEMYTALNDMMFMHSSFQHSGRPFEICLYQRSQRKLKDAHIVCYDSLNLQSKYSLGV